jgi:hypothetical protein
VEDGVEPFRQRQRVNIAPAELSLKSIPTKI